MGGFSELMRMLALTEAGLRFEEAGFLGVGFLQAFLLSAVTLCC